MMLSWSVRLCTQQSPTMQWRESVCWPLWKRAAGQSLVFFKKAHKMEVQPWRPRMVLPMLMLEVEARVAQPALRLTPSSRPSALWYKARGRRKTCNQLVMERQEKQEKAVEWFCCRQQQQRNLCHQRLARQDAVLNAKLKRKQTLITLVLMRRMQGQSPGGGVAVVEVAVEKAVVEAGARWQRKKKTASRRTKATYREKLPNRARRLAKNVALGKLMTTVSEYRPPSASILLEMG
mmetsp:Transcript_23366/g.45377  ORF Transcript_23366/g.45377 Transcript_23366/m.45377 type:complete len:235 (-) Transcript_23366:140-844(-)